MRFPAFFMYTFDHHYISQFLVSHPNLCSSFYHVGIKINKCIIYYLGYCVKVI